MSRAGMSKRDEQGRDEQGRDEQGGWVSDESEQTPC